LIAYEKIPTLMRNENRSRIALISKFDQTPPRRDGESETPPDISLSNKFPNA